MFKLIGAVVVYGLALYGLMEAFEQLNALIKPHATKARSGLS